MRRKPITVTIDELKTRIDQLNLDSRNTAILLVWLGTKSNDYVIRANGLQMPAVNADPQRETVPGLYRKVDEDTVHPELADILHMPDEGAEVSYGSIGDELLSMADALDPEAEDRESEQIGIRLERDVLTKAGYKGLSAIIASHIRNEYRRVDEMRKKFKDKQFFNLLKEVENAHHR